MNEINKNSMKWKIILLIARVAYEACRAFHFCTGNFGQKAWHNTTDEIREEVISGVLNIIFEGKTAAENFAMQIEKLKADGWQYGEKYDPEAKTLPTMVEWEKLPKLVQISNLMFASIVSLLDSQYDVKNLPGIDLETSGEETKSEEKSEETTDEKSLAQIVGDLLDGIIELQKEKLEKINEITEIQKEINGHESSLREWRMLQRYTGALTAILEMDKQCHLTSGDSREAAEDNSSGETVPEQPVSESESNSTATVTQSEQ